MTLTALHINDNVAWILIILLGISCICSCLCNFYTWKWGIPKKRKHIKLVTETDSLGDIRPYSFRSHCVCQTSLMHTHTPTSGATLLGHYWSSELTPNSDFSGSDYNLRHKIASNQSRVVSGITIVNPMESSKSDCAFYKRHRQPQILGRGVKLSIMDHPLTSAFPSEIQCTTHGTLQNPIFNLDDSCSNFFNASGYVPGHLIHESEIKIGSEIGKGSYGSVKIGIYSHMLVAIKILLKDWKDLTQAEKSEFLKEVSIATELSQHQNILRVYGYMKEPYIAIVTEYCEKLSVYDYINNPLNPRLDNMQKFGIAIGITKGLAFIHRNNVIHRDLAARNILLREDVRGFQPRIGDFGLARRLGDKVDSRGRAISTVTHQTANHTGPIKWMSPEALQGESSTLSDIWALGITIWEIFTEEIPYKDLNPITAAVEVITHNLRPDLSKIRMINPVLEKLLKRMWEKNPKKRPSLTDVLQDLQWCASNYFYIKQKAKSKYRLPVVMSHSSRSSHFSSSFDAGDKLKQGLSKDFKMSSQGFTRANVFPNINPQHNYFPFQLPITKATPSRSSPAKLVVSEHPGLSSKSDLLTPDLTVSKNTISAASDKSISDCWASRHENINDNIHTEGSDGKKDRWPLSRELGNGLRIVEPHSSDFGSQFGRYQRNLIEHSFAEKRFNFPIVSDSKIASITKDAQESFDVMKPGKILSLSQVRTEKSDDAESP